MAKAMRSGKKSHRAPLHRRSAASRLAAGMSAKRRTDTNGNPPPSTAATLSRPHSSSVPARVLSAHSTTHVSATASHMQRVTSSSATCTPRHAAPRRGRRGRRQIRDYKQERTRAHGVFDRSTDRPTSSGMEESAAEAR